MKAPTPVAGLVTEVKTNGRIVIVGASLAGLRAAEALRDALLPTIEFVHAASR